MPRIIYVFALTFAMLPASILTGCGAGMPDSTTITLPVLQGRVHGGQQPVSNSHVYLYAASQTAYGGASLVRLDGSGYIATDAGGNFQFAGHTTCQSGDLVYALAIGGNPGMAVGTNNSAMQLMTSLGPCSGLTTGSFFNINELTTVAAVYALAPFMVDSTHIGAPSTNVAGLTTAFATAGNLTSYVSGIPATTTVGGNGTVPQAEINSLGNSISACVNSDGTGSPCASLFAATTPAGGSAPTNTISALLNIALTPSTNAATIYALAPATPPFQPTLGAAPNDWSMCISYTAGLYLSLGFAIDAQGNLWFSNYSGNSLSKLNGLGSLISSNYAGGGLSGPSGLAIDLSGNLWVTNPNTNFLSEFSPIGAPLSATGFPGGGQSDTSAVAVDPSGNIWTANQNNNSASKFQSDGTAVSPSVGFPATSTPVSVAIDPSGAVWIGGRLNSTLVKLNADGTTAKTYTGFTFVLPQSLAFDASGSIWVSSYQGSLVQRISSSGVLQNTYTGGGLNFPYALGVDGASNAWVANSYSSVITRINGTTGVLTAFTIPGGNTTNPTGIAADASGNVWVDNESNVLEFVGAGTPTVNPVSLATKTGKLGVRP